MSIDQNYADSTENSFKRWSDCSYNGKTGFINKKGEKFKNFITAELIPYIDKEYRTTSFKTLVGHSFTANFVNYFLFDENPVFSGYVSISPYYAKNSLDSLEEVFKNLTAPVFYYVASGDNDLSGHIKSVNEFDQRMQKIDNAHFIYRKFDVENNQATHSSILPIAIPYAIEHIFSLFSPLKEQDYEQVLKTENKLNFLTQRYRNVENLYGITLPIRESDINIVAYAIMESKQWEQLKEISEIAITLYPENVYGYYLLGDYHEEKKEYSLALEQYEIGFSKLGEDVLNKEDFQEPINKLKKKIKSREK